MKSRWVLMILSLILLSRYGYAQYDFKTGYIVTHHGDTIHGYLDYANPAKNARNCFFKKEVNGTIDRYTPQEINAYSFSGSKLYVTKTAPLIDTTGLFFMEYLVDGVMDLYYLNEFGSDQFFIEKDNKLYRLSNEKVKRMIDNKEYVADSKTYVGLLLFLMEDAEPLKSQIERTEFNAQSLIDITKEYHDQVCDSVQCIVYYKKNKKLNDSKWRIRLGVSAEYNHSILTMNSKIIGGMFGLGYGEFIHEFVVNESNASFTSSAATVVPVVFLNIRRNNKTSFQIEARYQKTKHSLIELEEVKIPVLFNYEFMYYKNPRPFINVGIVNDFVLSTKVNGLYFNYDRLESYANDGSSYSYSTYEENVNENALDGSYFKLRFSVGMGMKYDLGEKNAIKAEVRGETGTGKEHYYSLRYARNIGAEIINNNVSFSLSFIF